MRLIPHLSILILFLFAFLKDSESFLDNQART